MCRLFGWAATEAVTAEALLGPDLARLQQLSHVHADGWGEAWDGPQGVRLVKEDRPAYTSAVFAAAVSTHCAATGLLHLRWATDNLPRCLPNTHPFVRGDVAFVHNGSIPRGRQLDDLIDTDVLATVDGDTDSERYFLALLSAYRRTGSAVKAFIDVTQALHELAWPSLNAIWVQPGTLVALAYHRPEHRPADLPEHYYDLHYDHDGHVVTVWSEGVRTDPGTLLPNAHLLVATAADAAVRLVPLPDPQLTTV